MQKKIFSSSKNFIAFTAVLFAAFLFFQFIGNPSELKAQSSDLGPPGCSIWGAGNASLESFYEGFGVPWDVFSGTGELLVRANCLMNSILLDIGNGEQDFYIWENAYISAAGSPWTQVSLNGGYQGGDWLRGVAFAQIPESQVASGQTNYLLTYTCQKVDGEFRCGCREEGPCDDTGLWQLQELKFEAPTVSLDAGSPFSLAADMQVPTIFYPSSYEISRGSSAILYGGGFGTGNEIFFEGYGSVNAAVNETGTGLSFQVPQNIPYGKYEVWVKDTNQNSNSTLLIVKDPAKSSPSVFSVAPSVAEPGEMITLYGSGFSLEENIIVTALGTVRGVVSADGQTLTFELPEPLRVENIPPPIERFIQEQGMTKQEFIDLQKNGRRTLGPIQQTVILRVINDNGISEDTEFSVQF